MQARGRGREPLSGDNRPRPLRGPLRHVRGGEAQRHRAHTRKRAVPEGRRVPQHEQEGLPPDPLGAQLGGASQPLGHLVEGLAARGREGRVHQRAVGGLGRAPRGRYMRLRMPRRCPVEGREGRRREDGVGVHRAVPGHLRRVLHRDSHEQRAGAAQRQHVAARLREAARHPHDLRNRQPLRHPAGLRLAERHARLQHGQALRRDAHAHEAGLLHDGRGRGAPAPRLHRRRGLGALLRRRRPPSLDDRGIRPRPLPQGSEVPPAGGMGRQRGVPEVPHGEGAVREGRWVRGAARRRPPQDQVQGRRQGAARAVPEGRGGERVPDHR